MDSQVDASFRRWFETRTCVRTRDGWPNGFTSRLASPLASRKFQTHTDDLRSTCIDLCTNMSLTKVNASQSKRSIVDAAVSTAKKKKRKKMKLYAGRSPSLVPDAG